ncbi:MAG: LytR C-terminal domain-containing protein [Bifidobacterium sp.]|nr:LytR C-terminal domain-containing protein [Bifidobacterium sp.]
MTNPEPLDEREARRQFVRRRQKMVFTIVVSALVAILVICSLIIFGSIGHTAKHATIIAKPNYGVAVPCPPDKSKLVNHPDIRVRVLNGTNKSGLATALASALRNRGFNMQDVADYPGKTETARTQIRFGASAIDRGYTVGSQFNDAVLIMDDRNDDLIDVVIGATFTDLDDEDSNSVVGRKIEAIKGCQTDPSSMKNLPKAPKA